MSFEGPSTRLPPALERAVGHRVPCATHPSVETHLRCARCGRAICPKCLVHAEGGALCPRCAARIGRSRGPTLSSLGVLLSAPLGLLIGAVGGAALTLVPF